MEIFSDDKKHQTHPEKSWKRKKFNSQQFNSHEMIGFVVQAVIAVIYEEIGKKNCSSSIHSVASFTFDSHAPQLSTEIRENDDD